MPYESHPDFEPPANAQTRVWRYLNLAKFLSLLDRSALFFVRADALAEQDPFEGYFPGIQLTADGRFPESERDQSPPDTVSPQSRHLQELMHFQRSVTFVNSWHAYDVESAAMWSGYAKNDEGVAIQSTYPRLLKSLDSYSDFGVFVGVVKYVDYSMGSIPCGNVLYPIMHKRRSFEHERELRAVIWTLQVESNSEGKGKSYQFERGIYVSVDLHELIEKVFVSPTAPKWLWELVASVVKKFNLDKEVVQSDLARAPVF